MATQAAANAAPADDALECVPSCETFRCPPPPNAVAPNHWDRGLESYCLDPHDSNPDTKCVAPTGSGE
jgi:hypothetical protein